MIGTLRTLLFGILMGIVLGNYFNERGRFREIADASEAAYERRNESLRQSEQRLNGIPDNTQNS